MLFKIGLENNIEGRSLAWVLEHPGCFAYGADGESALANVYGAIREYGAWIAQHETYPWVETDQMEVRLEETWQCYYINEAYERVDKGYEVNAWFLFDWKPLTAEEIARGLKVLTWSRNDLIASVENLTQEQLERQYPGERWNIHGILGHVAKAEWWYLDRLNLSFPFDRLPENVFERLDMVRTHFNRALPTLEGVPLVRGIEGEFWSPRKMLRRAVWHERDHTEHIRKLIALDE